MGQSLSCHSLPMLSSSSSPSPPPILLPQSDAWKKKNKRETINCAGDQTIEAEIISEQYVQTLHKLGAQTLIIDPIPDTPYTIIPGGRQIFWGMAFNKLKIFNLTQYEKVIWMDSDTMVLRNLDHIVHEPMFTAAMTYDCCNPK